MLDLGGTESKAIKIERYPLPDAGLGKLTMNIEILNSLNNVCGMMVGPHLDMLKRQEQTAILQNNSKVGRRQHWWGVVTQGRFNLYQEYGDVRPRIEIDARLITIETLEPTARDADEDFFSIVLPDMRKWLFQVPTKKDLARWTYAIEVQGGA